MAVCLVAASACTGDAIPVGAAARVVVAAGNAQRGEVNALLPGPVRLQVVDADGRPVSNVTVELTITAGAGSVPQNPVMTDDDGIAVVFWTLGASPGLQRLEARIGTQSAAEILAIACLPSGCEAPVLDEVRLMSLTTYDGSGQVVHPDVAIGTGPLAGFWLAITPYPDGDAGFENPSIFDGVDGVVWTPPLGLVNPMERPVSGGYLSDPDIVLDEGGGQLWMFYRQVAGGQNVVMMTRSGDGIRWGPATPVISVPSHQLVSPAVVRGAPGTPWTMWSVNSGSRGCSARNTTIERRTSTDGVRWSAPAATDLLQTGRVIWHLDVEWIAAFSEYWAIYNSYPSGGTCATDALYLARSADGIHWTTYPSPIVTRGVSAAFADIVYRSTFRADPATGTVTLWLSGATFTLATGYTWRAATLTRRIADLLATAAAPASARAAMLRRDLPPPEPDVGP